MKASEMTNEELAKAIERRVAEAAHNWDFAPTLSEAAARLRNVTVRSDNSAVIAELQRRLKVAEEICNHEIACRQATTARCEMCQEDSSAGEDCPYHGEPNGCNSPTYGEYPSEKECEPFVAIIAAIRGEGGAK